MEEAIVQWFQHLLQDPSELQLRLIKSVVVAVAFYLLRLIALRTLERRVQDSKSLYQWRKTITYTLVLIAALFIGRVWSPGFETVSTFLGLLSAGLAIALRDPIVNLAGWLFILWRRPFKVGDRIQIGEHRGDVIDIRIFQFSLLEIGNWVQADQSTGRVIHIPNGMVFTAAQANYGQAFRYIWNELPVLVTFESNWKVAKRILTDIANEHSLHLSKEAEEQVKEAARRYMVFYSHLTPIVYTSVADSGVLLTIRYLCDARARRGTAQGIWEDVLDRFADRDDIDFAYPSIRYYDNIHEGKPGARATLGDQ
ncbi:MAG: mechanosensitive ion channel family protein [Acidobacteriota bacterium]|nr:MAG: mechanosensitive ion channel family protein [Acidobacteriota bacterium]